MAPHPLLLLRRRRLDRLPSTANVKRSSGRICNPINENISHQLMKRKKQNKIELKCNDGNSHEKRIWIGDLFS
jgi:hypothetical protein